MKKRVVRPVTRWGYQTVVKPVLFRQSPDAVHEGLIKVGKITQKLPIVKHAPQLWRHRSAILQQELFGITFPTPVGLSAGFDKNIELVPTMKRVGFGFMIGGSVTALPCDGNPHPWFHRLPKTRSLVVYAGLPNKGIRRIIANLRQYPKSIFHDFPLSVSVAKTNSPEVVSDAAAIEDYCESLRQLEHAGINQLYEINISCPNTYGGEPFTTPDRLGLLLDAIDRLKLSRPVFIKMPISLSWNDFRKLLDVIVAHDVQGVTIGNLLKDRSKAVLHDPLNEEVKGSLSGAPTRDISTRLIERTYKMYGDTLCIIGVGGVFTAQQAYDKIKAGASLVALISGAIFEGPQIAGDINQGLEQLLKGDGYQSVADAVGRGV